MATLETINGVTFETRKIAAKNAHNGRVVYYVNGLGVSAAIFALDRAAALLGAWEAQEPTHSAESVHFSRPYR